MKNNILIGVIILILVIWFSWFFRYSIVATHETSAGTAYRLDRITGKVYFLTLNMETDVTYSPKK